jgi:hypothetical protein
MLLEKVQMQHQGFSFHRLHKALIWRLNNSKTDSTIGWSKIQRQTNHHQLQYTVIINTKQWSSSIIKLKILIKKVKNKLYLLKLIEANVGRIVRPKLINRRSISKLVIPIRYCWWHFHSERWMVHSAIVTQFSYELEQSLRNFEFNPIQK